MDMDEVQQAEQALRRAQQKANAEARKEYLDKLEAKKAATRKAEAQQAEAQRVRAEATLKLECEYRFLNAGGTQAEFEKQWPTIRLERLKQIAAGTGAPSFVEERAQALRSSGRYGNL
jgi:uncharacterized protein involved in type VI secretion and phage assembly